MLSARAVTLKGFTARSLPSEGGLEPAPSPSPTGKKGFSGPPPSASFSPPFQIEGSLPSSPSRRIPVLRTFGRGSWMDVFPGPPPAQAERQDQVSKGRKMSLELSRFLAGSLFGLTLLSSSCTTTQEEPGAAPENPPSAEAATMSSKTGKTSTAGTQGTNSAGGARNQGTQGTLQAQHRNFLIGRYMDEARSLVARGRYDDAKLALERALDIDPDRPEVLRLYHEVQVQLGERTGEVLGYHEHMQRLAEIRIQKDIAEARQLISEAGEDLEAGRYEAAITKLKKVGLRVEIGTSIDWKEIPSKARALLKRAESERDEAERAAQEAAQREAFLRLRRQEEKEQARRKARIDFLLAKGTKAFEERDFRSSRDLADAALEIDPLHEVARRLYSASERALRNEAREGYLVAKAREFKKFLEANEERKIPYTDILVPPDPGYWARISKIRGIGSTAAGAVAETLDPETAALRKRLDELKVPKGAEFTDESGGYIEVLDYLGKITGLPILPDPEARETIEGNALTLTIKLEAPLSLRNFLDIMVSRSDGALAWTIREGAVIMTTKGKALGKPVPAVYPIQDLTFGLSNFAGPVLKDLPVSGEEESEDRPRAGGVVGEKLKFIDAEALTSLIQSSVAQGTWDGEGVSIEATETNLIVVHTPEVQRKVQQFLDDLRKFSTSMVTVESKFLRVDQNWLQQFGVDFRGLGGANAKGRVAELDDITNGLDDNASRGLDNSGTGGVNSHPISGFFYDDGLDGDFRGRTENFFQNPLGGLLTTNGGATFGFTLLDDVQLNILARAVEKSMDVQIVDSQLLTVLNGQRANMSVINQTTYIQDFSVEVAQAAFIADPEINVVQDGVVLDVRPSISYDRKYITLDLQPTVAELARPIPTFTTSLSGSTLPVTIMFPQMTVRSAATTVKVPDGGSVLIGGLNEVLNRERRAEVPWLAQLPLVSFLFKEEGTVEENSSLMVLVKAYIVDVEEIMKNGGR